MGLIEDIKTIQRKLPELPSRDADAVLIQRGKWARMKAEIEQVNTSRNPALSPYSMMGLPVWTYHDDIDRLRLCMYARDRGIRLMEVTSQQEGQGSEHE